ncbi:hypothetical protein G3A49_11295 [Haloferax volcanii]|uniref:Uncharacterized protein n=3 Tax=Haloferax volcanii TaxID=2246 RepID=A0A6C0UT59_HALVO|nr:MULTISPECIES: hypothetical protein [Haloferax]ELZ74458.1 hypothetical protein C456_08823 [Haloferax lucentense DSM 14919]ELZ93736.1 hypothetical protein C452_02632 [Haloferax alexandrinus JCM 10717]NLV02531.1 hypothetical protein [Haloferax alexandrinus]QIB78695.1 hypothetical protein G3A49_11295 [Haloferax alexandrinus]TVT95637.1 hypothetical protein FQA18_05365 [Haloferax volcanii]
MATSYAGRLDPRHAPRLWWLAALCWVEALAVGAYLSAAPERVESLRYLFYPFVWITVGAAAVLWTEPPRASARARVVAGAVAAAYFLVLAALAGLVSVDLAALFGSHGHAAAHYPTGWQFSLAAPGWGPRVGYAGEVVSATFVPYRVAGYLALAYLVYAAALDAARRALSGALGLVSCVGCTVPLVGGLTAGAAGGTGVVSALRALSVDISTLVFVAAVALLALGPSLAARARR